MTKEELVELAHDMGVENGALRREEIVFHLLEAIAKRQGYVLATGLLEIIGDGYGFLRQQGLRAGPGDVYISQSQIRRFGLRTGDQVTGQVRPPQGGRALFRPHPRRGGERFGPGVDANARALRQPDAYVSHGTADTGIAP